MNTTTDKPTISNEVRAFIAPMAKQAGFTDVYKYYELVFNKIFLPLMTRERDPLPFIPESKIWEAFVLARRANLNPLYGQIYAGVYGGEITVDLTAKGYLSALINNPDYKTHKMIFSKEKVTCPQSQHSVNEWCALVIEFKDGRVIEGIPEFFLENVRNTNVWVKYPSRLNAMKALTRGVGFALSLDCGDNTEVMELEFDGIEQNQTPSSSMVMDEDEKPEEVKVDPSEALDAEWKAFIRKIGLETDVNLVTKIVNNMEAKLAEQGKVIHFTSSKQLDDMKNYLSNTTAINFKKLNEAKVKQEQEAKAESAIEPEQQEDIAEEEQATTEAETVVEAKAEDLVEADNAEPVSETVVVEVIEPETEEVKSEEAQSNVVIENDFMESMDEPAFENFDDYDFTLISPATKHTIDQLAAIADEKGDLSFYAKRQTHSQQTLKKRMFE